MISDHTIQAISKETGRGEGLVAMQQRLKKRGLRFCGWCRSTKPRDDWARPHRKAETPGGKCASCFNQPTNKEVIYDLGI